MSEDRIGDLRGQAAPVDVGVVDPGPDQRLASASAHRGVSETLVSAIEAAVQGAVRHGQDDGRGGGGIIPTLRFSFS